MKIGELNRVITISTRSESVTSGDVTESWSSPVSVRAKVTNVDGTRYLSADELIDRSVCKFQLWDNSYSDNIRIAYLGYTFYPIRPLTKNPGEGSHLNEVTILAATKR